MAKQEPTSGAAIPLSRGKKLMATAGSLCLMLYVTMIGLSLATLRRDILTEMDAMENFTLLAICGSLGIAMFNPIGGKLGDLFGRRNVVLVAGTLAAVSGIALGLVRTFVPFAVLTLVCSAAQGAFTAVPYILAREINEAKDVPKATGLLASAVSVGTLLGALIAGVLADLGFLRLAIMYPVVVLVIGIVLISLSVPNRRRENVKIDVPGILLLMLTLGALLLSLNYAPRAGWTHPAILGGLALALLAGFLLVRVEGRAQEPVIPLRLFQNRPYVLLLLTGFLCYFYQGIQTDYAPLFVQSVLGGSTAVAGALQMPRTILVMLLPTFAGAWVGRRQSNSWKAMALATGVAAVAYVPLIFMNGSTPVLLLIACIALTGVAESFRAVSTTPAAQSLLDPADMGVGTSLTTFANTLAGTIGAGVYGAVYNAQGGNVQAGFNRIALVAVAVEAAGLLLVLLAVRRYFRDRD